MKRYNVYYIPWDELMGDKSLRTTQWKVIYADNAGEAKNHGRQDGLVTEVSLKRKMLRNNITLFNKV